jgi:diacylglycerol kinase family enzyme
MLILINPKACGGTALSKWETIKPDLLNILNNPNTIYLNGDNSFQRNLKEAIQTGETQFVSAGGDGTLNLLLNSIINNTSTDQLNNIKIGAIGIGSSNDFYKPVSQCNCIKDIPVKLNFEKPLLRDVGIITIENEGIIRTKYFLINSSIGITAEANYFFNKPDKFLSSLKRKNTNLAIIYAALRELIKYKNFNAEIISEETGKINAKITNLGVIKNPNFSGSMNYGYSANYENGLFNIHLCYDMNLKDRLKLFWALNNRKFENVQKIKSWTTDKLVINSIKPFFVEFDGEIIISDSVKFSVLPKFIKVCK